MGCINSSPYSKPDHHHTPEARDVNKTIDEETEKYALDEQLKYKLLLLGVEDSGKSALLRQIRLLHGDCYDQSELLAIKPQLIQNVIEAMQTIAIHTNTLSDEETETIRRRIISTNINDNPLQLFTQELYEDFVKLLSDPQIQRTMKYKNDGRFEIIDTAEYLLENMHKYCIPDYIPTFTDMIHSRKTTTNINKVRFAFQDNAGSIEEVYEIFEMDPQKTAYRKWMHFFDNTTAIIFVASLSGYNQYKLGRSECMLISGYIRISNEFEFFPPELSGLIEQYCSANEMQKSIQLFGDIINLNVFKETHIILFLNKSDVFDQKIGKYPVRDHFEDFDGEEATDDAIQFFKRKFRNQRRNSQNYLGGIHFHITCATDTSCIKKMFESCRTIIIKDELLKQGFLKP